MTPRLLVNSPGGARLDPFQNIVSFGLFVLGPDIVTWHVAFMFDNIDLVGAHYQVNRSIRGVVMSLRQGGPDLGFDPADPALQLEGGIRTDFVFTPGLQTFGSLPDFSIPIVNGFPSDIIMYRYGINQLFGGGQSVVATIAYLDGPRGTLDPSEYGYPAVTTDVFGNQIMTGTDGKKYLYPGDVPTWDGITVSTFGNPPANYAVDKS